MRFVLEGATLRQDAQFFLLCPLSVREDVAFVAFPQDQVVVIEEQQRVQHVTLTTKEAFERSRLKNDA